MAEIATLKDILGDNIGTLKRSSLGEEASDKLRELILLEKLPPGQSLNERDLSATLGISRTPVREAIRQLELEGLVDFTETRRPRVADPSPELLAQWLAIQGTLEALAGELACANASDDELGVIVGMQQKMVGMAESDDRLTLFDIDMEFHNAIVAASHNPPLVDVHRTFNARLWRARFVSSQRRAKRQIQMEKHQDIVNALLARDAEAAALALRQHLANAVDNIIDALAEREQARGPEAADGE